MSVIIGVDPHKASHTAVAIGGDEPEVAKVTVRATCQQTPKLLAWAEPFAERTWAIESAGGLGYLLAQQLVDAGEVVLDVPPTLASRVRVLSTGRSEKNDPNGPRSRLLLPPCARGVFARSSRRTTPRSCDCSPSATTIWDVCGPSSSAGSTTPWPSSRQEELPRNSTFLMPIASSDPSSRPPPIEHMRHQLALELVDDVAGLDEQIKESHRRIRTAVLASKTSLTDLFGVGPVLACSVIGYSGDVARFANRDSYAAYTGIAPVEHSSGGRIFHRLSLRGHRRLEQRHPHGCDLSDPPASLGGSGGYFDRKVAEGKTKREALRSLKRHVSNALFRQLVIDSERVQERRQERLSLRGRLCTLKAGSSAKSLPDHPKPTHLSRLVAGREL